MNKVWITIIPMTKTSWNHLGIILYLSKNMKKEKSESYRLSEGYYIYNRSETSLNINFLSKV